MMLCLSTPYMIPKCLNACIIASSFSGVIYSYVAFPLNSDKSISSREKSTFTFLLSTILRSTSVRAEQRSTGPLAPLESKTTVSTCVVSVLGTHNVYLVLNYPIVQVNNSADRSAVPPVLPASVPAEISSAFPG